MPSLCALSYRYFAILVTVPYYVHASPVTPPKNAQRPFVPVWQAVLKQLAINSAWRGQTEHLCYVSSGLDFVYCRVEGPLSALAVHL